MFFMAIKIFFKCSTEEIKTSLVHWGWVNKQQILILGWILPLSIISLEVVNSVGEVTFKSNVTITKK